MSPRLESDCKVPKNNSNKHATQLDKSNKNDKWQDDIAAELYQQMECETCKNLSYT